MMSRIKWMWIGLVILAAAACSQKDQKQPASTPQDTPNLVIPSLPIQSPGGGLPGCSDPNDTECPAALSFDLDGEASSGGVTIRYPARYFDATTGGDPVLIAIQPSEKYAFPEQASFQVYFADSIDQALAELQDPLMADWTAATGLSGKVGVVKDRAQDPPVNTVIGAFSLPDGRVIVLKLVATGKYGWDLFSQIYSQMLDTLTVGGS
jgi:hypothetical protein